MTKDQWTLLKLHLAGYVQVVLHVFGLSLFVIWGLQGLGMLYGFEADWSRILVQVFLSLCFLVFYPGQRFWTYRMIDTEERTHVIVGVHSLDDVPYGLPKDG